VLCEGLSPDVYASVAVIACRSRPMRTTERAARSVFAPIAAAILAVAALAGTPALVAASEA